MDFNAPAAGIGRTAEMQVTAEGLSLGVSGFGNSPAGHMQAGRVYGFDTDVPSIRFPLISSCLAAALDAGVPCSLIVRSRPENYLEHLNTPAKFDIDEVLSRRLLNVFVMQNDFQRKLFQTGPDRMLAELGRFGVQSGSFVVFEHASELLNMFDQYQASSQLDAISDWCARYCITALLVFSGTPTRNALSPKALLDGMAGMARMEQGYDGLLIGFPYWRSNGQLVSGLQNRLQLNVNGEYVAMPLLPGKPDWGRPAAPAARPDDVSPAVAPGTQAGATDVAGYSSTAETAAGLFTLPPSRRDFEGRQAHSTEFTARVRRLNVKAQRSVAHDFLKEIN